MGEEFSQGAHQVSAYSLAPDYCPILSDICSFPPFPKTIFGASMSRGLGFGPERVVWTYRALTA